MEAKSIDSLLGMLLVHKGSIVSIASLPPNALQQARASGRLFTDESYNGFIWMPDLKFPETESEVEQFEKWFPLDEPIADGLKSTTWITKFLEIKEQKKHN